MKPNKKGGNDANLLQLCNTIGYTFKNINLLTEALSHPSLRVKKNGRPFNYERLEFLGDSVLDFVITNMLFNEYPDDSEGSLSKKVAYFVSREFCYSVGEQIEIARFMLISPGEENNGGRALAANISNSVEALIAAIYLDGGYECAKDFVHAYWFSSLDETKSYIDAKTALQEWSQNKLKTLPTYTTIGSEGPEHVPTFLVKVDVGTPKIPDAIGRGKSKKMAEKDAARRMLEQLQIQTQNM